MSNILKQGFICLDSPFNFVLIYQPMFSISLAMIKKRVKAVVHDGQSILVITGFPNAWTSNNQF